MSSDGLLTIDDGLGNVPSGMIAFELIVNNGLLNELISYGDINLIDPCLDIILPESSTITFIADGTRQVKDVLEVEFEYDLCLNYV